MSKIYIYIIVFLLGAIAGGLISQCARIDNFPNIGKIIDADTTVSIKISQTIAKSDTPAVALKPILRTKKDSIKLIGVYGKIDSLIAELGRLDTTASIEFIDTLITERNDSLIQIFDLAKLQFDATVAKIADTTKIVNRNIDFGFKKQNWYEKPAFTMPVSFLAGAVFMILIKK
ncbi:MAG TPA: hypothetical protein PLC04_08020 [Candidatus Kapabacteria bacterium]|nr:hypothetical protein [Candidatus Kapabacteria bacterium]